MVQLVSRLANINSFSHHVPGLAVVAELLRQEFAGLNPDRVETIALPPAEALSAAGEILQTPLGELLSFSKRADAPIQALLVIHYDTVYAPEHAFTSVTRADEATLRGPGVADAKGGIVVMQNALLALEQSADAAKLGWTVLLNPDEEIGSPGSAHLLAEAAKRADLAMVFEPAPTAQTLVTRRKGSGNFSVIFHGRSAHAGREIEKGRNAVLAAARFAIEATAAISGISGATINVGKIDGGGPVNVVPDLAILRLNLRVETPEQQRQVEGRLAELVAAANRDDITAALHGQFSSPPWTPGERPPVIFEELCAAGRELGLDLHATSSGGASDANKIASAGLPVLDSLGPVGFDIHSQNERIHIPSLVERAKLSALLLTKLASGRIAPPPARHIPTM
ncbi:MAG: acetylornithine deacetylase/succinyldiaminopimelate desuccinylase-like deacylase [Phycisphaerales bacterium]|nr:acetylornithine deacetylase/succinyldiaminopimelate desuccinylase-like deacylase [Phycisphaerales bacterium]